MNKNIYNSIPKERSLSYDVIKGDVIKLFDFFINKIDREFPFKDVPDAKNLFLIFSYIAKNTYSTIFYICAKKCKKENEL